MSISSPKLTLTLLEGLFAVCRLDPKQPIPAWATSKGFYSITRSEDELSIVCAESATPADARCERGFRLLRFEGPFAFCETGILASVVAPLADAKISVFAISTFDTDYLLIKQKDMDRAFKVL